MKKLLLLAAAAVALSANAQPTLTKDWKVDVANLLPGGDCRQGVGMNGKVYVNNRTEKKIYVVGQNGVEETKLPGGLNCGINHDDAGNLVISDAKFPNTWRTDTTTIKVLNPETLEEANYAIPADALGAMTRQDVLGKAMGNMMEEGALALQGLNSTGITLLRIADGEVDEDNSYLASFTGTGANQAFSSLYTVEDDEVMLLFRPRNAALQLFKLEGDNFEAAFSYDFAKRGNSVGGDYFVLGGKPYYVQSTQGNNGTKDADLTNYLDGFAIWDLTEEPVEGKIQAPVAEVLPEYAAAAAGNNQGNYLYAEVVNENEAKIYQYYVGGFCAQYTFALPSEPTGVNDVTAKEAKVSKVYENGQVYIIKGDAKYNVMGAQVK